MRSDLSLHAKEASEDGIVLVESARAVPEPSGAFVGPIFLDGRYARHLRRLPARLRRGMAAPVGPTPMFLDGGAGLGMYVRL